MQTRVTLPSPVADLRRTAPSLVEFWVGVTLCALLMLATTWAVLAGDWVARAGGTLPVVLVGVAEAALLVRMQVSRAVAVIAGPLFALVAALPFTIATIPADGNASVAHLVVRYAGAMWLPQSLFSADGRTFLVALSLVLWVCAYFATWMAVRERNGGAAVFPCLFVLALNILNAPRSFGLVLPSTVAVALAATVVAQANLSRLAATWRHRSMVVLPGMFGRYMRSAAVMLGLVLLVAALAPPVSSYDLTQSILGSGSPGGLQSSTANRSSQPVGFSVDTVLGGAISAAHPQTLFRYTTDAPAPLYIALATDSQFQNGVWTHGEGSAIGDGSGGDVLWAASAPELGAETRVVHLDVTALTSDSTNATIGARSVALAPWVGTPLSVSVPANAIGIVRSADGAGRLLTVDRLELVSDLKEGTSLSITGAVSTATIEQLRGARQAYPDAFTQEYTNLPGDSATDTLIGIARDWTSGTGNSYDAAVAIETHLRSSAFTYTLTPPQAPDGTLPIIDFLTHSHKGYCQYFASAMAALLRAEGIPSRIVNGYANGTRTSVDAKGDTVYTVTSNDAHSWVEAYFPHYGWIPFEPTPPSQLGYYQPPVRGAVTLLGVGATPNAVPRAYAGHTPSALVLVLLGLLLVLVLLGLAGVWLARPRDLRTLWRRMAVVGRLLGVRRRPCDTDAAFTARLMAAIPPDRAALRRPRGDAGICSRSLRASICKALDEIAVLSGKAQFSSKGIDATERVRWLRCWRQVARALPRLVWRSLLARRRVVEDPYRTGVAAL